MGMPSLFAGNCNIQNALLVLLDLKKVELKSEQRNNKPSRWYLSIKISWCTRF